MCQSQKIGPLSSLNVPVKEVISKFKVLKVDDQTRRRHKLRLIRLAIRMNKLIKKKNKSRFCPAPFLRFTPPGPSVKVTISIKFGILSHIQ